MVAEFQKQKPYVGPRPFEREDRKFFFGRDREINDLSSLVVAHGALLLHAPSGAGKTSFLNAGLIPRLEEKGFEVLPPARVVGQKPEEMEPKEIEELPNIYIFNTLVSLMSWAKKDPRQLVGMSLAEFLGEREHPTGEDGFPSPRVVIFDQFEELFSTYPERWPDREGFFQQVGDALEEDPLLLVVLVIREEYLAKLERYTPLLLEKLRIHFRLEPLGEEAALLAIKGPLEVVEPRRSFAEGVAEELIEYLRKIRIEREGKVIEETGEFVEPVCLQVACWDLWQGLPPGVKEITRDRLEGVNWALSRFYEESLEKVSQETSVREGELREWFERELITSVGTRGMICRGEKKTGGIPNEAVDVLVERHLIKGMWKREAIWYELDHDRFIEPILESNEKWRKAPKKLLMDEAKEWQRRERDVWSLLRGKQLARVAEWAKDHAEEMSPLEREFFQASMAIRPAVNAFNISPRDAELGLLLAIEAAQTAPTFFMAEDALRLALLASGVEEVLRGHEAAVYAVAISPDGSRLVTASKDETARLWNVERRKEVAVLSGHKAAVRDVAFSPDGRRVATASEDKTIRLWEAESGRRLGILRGHMWEVYAVAFSPDGKQVATAGVDNTARLWDAESGDELAVLRHWGQLHAVAFSPDGEQLATAGRDGTVCLWDIERGEKMAVLRGHKGEVRDVAFGPDGKRIATASWDNTARLWDAEKEKELAVLRHERYEHEIWAVAFSQDGRRLATTSSNGTACLWDAESGDELAVLHGHKGPVYDVAFGLDGKVVATVGRDGTIRLHLVRIEDLIELAKSKVSRELTPKERERYLP